MWYGCVEKSAKKEKRSSPIHYLSKVEMKCKPNLRWFSFSVSPLFKQ